MPILNYEYTIQPIHVHTPSTPTTYRLPKRQRTPKGACGTVQNRSQLAFTGYCFPQGALGRPVGDLGDSTVGLCGLLK